jgi:hypothetical protein
MTCLLSDSDRARRRSQRIRAGRRLRRVEHRFLESLLGDVIALARRDVVSQSCTESDSVTQSFPMGSGITADFARGEEIDVALLRGRRQG